jgi:glycolate oxidase
LILPSAFIVGLRDIIGAAHLREGAEAMAPYAADALGIAHPPDVVALPGSTAEIAAIARLCQARRVPMVVRGAGTGYTGGAVPTAGGLVISMERLNGILEIDDANLLAVVQPNVITGDLQRQVEARGLFYPPDPASLDRSSIGGNIAECAGGPRAFKYGTTRHYVLALEIVLPNGDIVRTGSKAVKNVVGYDLTQLIVGSEGTLAIVTEAVLRLVPKPIARATLTASFATIGEACAAVTELLRRRAVPAAIELIDGDSLRAIEARRGEALVARGADAMVIVECDGAPVAADEEASRVADACRAAGALDVTRAADDHERERLWGARRELSFALRDTGLLKINHDVVVPRGRIPALFDLIAALRRDQQLRIAAFGHAGDGNIHVNFMVDRQDADELRRARAAERLLFERVVALEGSITGEHGIGFAKRQYLGIELSPAAIALMRQVKAAFDPEGLLNPGKIFPGELP